MKPDLVKMRHDLSVKEYPDVTLEDNEYVVLKIVRTKVGIFLIWAVMIIGMVCSAVPIFINIINPSALTLPEQARGFFYMLLFVLIGVFAVMGLVLTHVYKQNYMYITNLRIIRYSTYALFARSHNVIDLISIEDVSFRQTSVLQHLFQFGTVRLSTVGDETTYTFPFVDTPRDEIDTISHLVHEMKEHKAPGAVAKV